MTSHDQRTRERVTVGNVRGEAWQVQGEGRYPFEVVDFTMQGMQVALRDPPPEGTRLELRFDVDGLDGTHKRITLQGEIVRNKISEGVPMSGVRFLDTANSPGLDELESIYIEQFFDNDI